MFPSLGPPWLQGEEKEGRPMRKRRRFVLGATVLSLAMVLAACSSGGDENTNTGGTPSAGGTTQAQNKGTITVGVSAAFAENQIIAEMYAQVLEKAGYTVKRQLDLETREISQPAIESGQIDLKPEYLSSLLLALDPNGEASGDTFAVWEKDNELLAPKGVELLTPSPAQDSNVFVANADTATKYALTTVSSVQPVANKLTLGGPPECPQRPFCIPGLKNVYGITFKDFKALDVGGPQTVAALKSNAVQIGLLFSTDPSITQNGFVPLVDDKHLQNAENITPEIRSDVVTPEIKGLLDQISAALNTTNVTDLVGKVVNDKQDAATVANDFLTLYGLA
jgi:osmoprotectant transport system substrate-binding protein